MRQIVGKREDYMINLSFQLAIRITH